MDPEQRLFIIHKYLAVKVNILFFCAFARILSPERMNIADGNRPLNDLYFLFRLSLFAFFRLFRNMLDNLVGIQQIGLVDCLIFFLRVRF